MELPFGLNVKPFRNSADGIDDSDGEVGHGGITVDPVAAEDDGDGVDDDGFDAFDGHGGEEAGAPPPVLDEDAA